MSNYDVIIIGAGPAGYVCAIRASQLGLKVAVIEREYLGGVCLNVGCIPSKALLKNAEVADTLRNRAKEFGFSFENLELDFGTAVKRSRQISSRLVKGVEFLMKKNKIDVHMGTAKLTAKDTIVVTDNDGKNSNLKAKNIVIATGAQVMELPGIELDGKNIISYKEAILQEKLPTSVLIIGAGAIGMEFATVWNAYGSQVTIVELLPRVLPNEDEEVSKEVAKEFKKAKINILTDSKVTKVENFKNKVKVNVESNGKEEIFEVEQVLVAAGFSPNSSDLGLEELSVEIGSRGEIIVDKHMATNVPGIWAIGDVTAKLMLAHAGSAMGIVCAENMAGMETVELDFKMMPKATYCHPQVASFGMTKAEAIEAGYEVKIGRFNFQANGKALGLGDRVGWVKIVTDAKYGEILGIHMVGPDVTELLPELTLAQMMEITIKEISQNVHAHPTLSEVIMEAAHDAEGHAIHQ
jgi:dihydrolipoamide dehydrogenase